MSFRPALLAALAAVSLLAVPAAAQESEEERVTLLAEDGWELSARYLRAAGEAPTVVLLHQQRSDHDDWKPWLPYLKRYGFGYLAVDLRGHGNSFVTPDGSTTSWRSFGRSGPANEYNRMVRDAEAALAFLSTNSVTADNVVLAGSVLGANLAIKTAAIHPEIPMVVAVSPVLNVYDVLSVNPLRAYGERPILMIGGAGHGRQYKEFLLLNDIARRACGRENSAVIVEYKGFGNKLITKYNAKRVLDWIQNPRLPEIVEFSTAAAPGTLPDTEGAFDWLDNGTFEDEESSGGWNPEEARKEEEE